MIISASRRTDIPAFHMESFIQDIRNGCCVCRNPFNPKQIRTISLLPNDVDAFVFWTKNPAPMLPYVNELQNLAPFYIMVSITGYGPTMEPHVPAASYVIDAVHQISEQISADRCIWRYDPILFNDDYTPEWHTRNFASIANELHDYTHRCIVSIIDLSYKSAARRLKAIKPIHEFSTTNNTHTQLLRDMSDVCHLKEMQIQSCASQYDLSPYGIQPGACVDSQLISNHLGISLRAKRDKNQRKQCLCQQAVDIGSYNTCQHGCLYCYAVK